MRTLVAHAPQGSRPSDALALPFEDRQKSRLRARLESGEEVALLLPRGRVLRGGDLLQTEDGTVVAVVAADESVSTARAADAGAVARAAYHLGNRHVAVQVGEGFVRYLHDHVLDDMVSALGLELTIERGPFEPEAGAYGGGAHAHGHEHHAPGDAHHHHSHDPEDGHGRG